MNSDQSLSDILYTVLQRQDRFIILKLSDQIIWLADSGFKLFKFINLKKKESLFG